MFFDDVIGETETAKQTKVEMVESKIVETYVSDLKGLLEKGTIMERKSFLKTFVKRIEVDYLNVTIYYTIPLDTKKENPSNSEVLPIKWNGSPNKVIDRTFKTSFRFPRKNESLFMTNEWRYRNPIILAQELDERLCRGDLFSKADMARTLEP
ncbi:hypothetical protein GWO43_01020 [candidate division KSB1 bacterium]|nr:hypothetical protein [candidate division KSB1 bacterium]NIV68557.1 hypothetical protein [Phycisphaerae bacterium]NIR69112.1 hypothetical protein [candidate division KSB1 bacterium]NIS22643.1 hypothetical protein [candidate division KSB1 bacterium]NIT69501.1 hypothetical protein [candidate division KSB1 bacterium]